MYHNKIKETFNALNYNEIMTLMALKDLEAHHNFVLSDYLDEENFKSLYDDVYNFVSNNEEPYNYFSDFDMVEELYQRNA